MKNTFLFIDAYYVEKTEEIVILTNCKLNFFNVKNFELKKEIKNSDLGLDIQMNAICQLNENYLLIISLNNLYLFNVVSYQFNTVIQLDKEIRGVTCLKKDSKGNIFLVGNNYYHLKICKGIFIFKDYFMVYRYNDVMGLDKIHEDVYKDINMVRIIDFDCLNENEKNINNDNKIAFVFSYKPYFSEKRKEYLKISNINI